MLKRVLPWILPLVLALPAAAFAAPEEFDDAWTERVVTGGVTHLEREFDDLAGGWQRIDVLVIDPWRADLEFRPAWSGNGTCQATSETARSVGAVAAVNAGFFGGPCMHVGELQLSGERLVEQSYENSEGRTSLGWAPEGGFRFETVPPGGFMEDVWHSLGAGPRLVRDGEVADEARSGFEGFSHGAYRHPRTAVAVTHGGLVLLVVVDGRTGPLGMTFEQLAEFLLGLGVRDAMNLDGGGSTTMWLDAGEGGEVVNTPSDGGERNVHSILAVVPTTGRPVADTTEGDRTILLGEQTTLDGSASYDPDGDPLRYHWFLAERPDGSVRTLTGGDVPSVLFTPDLEGTYVAELYVDDATYVSPVHRVSIVAQVESVTDDVADPADAPSGGGTLCSAVGPPPRAPALFLVALFAVRRRR